MQPDVDAPIGVRVTGYGEASASPDVLRVVLTISCDGADVSSAMSDAAQRTDAVTTALRELDVTDRDLRTEGVDVHRRHNRGGAVAGYRAQHTLAVTCRDVDRAGRLLAAAGDAAGNDLSIDHVGLDIEDRTTVLQQARQAAFEDARGRAERYAVLAGRELGEVQTVVEGTSAGPPAPRGGIRMMAAAAESAELGVEGGDSTLGATVTVTWSWA